MRGARCKQSHILHEDGIYPTLLQLLQEAARVLQFVVVDDGVDGDVDLSPKLVGIAAKFGNVGYAVARRRSGAKALGTDIHSIGTVIDSGDAALQILGGSQQFQWSRHLISSIL